MGDAGCPRRLSLASPRPCDLCRPLCARCPRPALCPTLYPRGPVCVPFPSPRAALHLELEGLVEGLVDASTEQTLGSAFGLRRETDTNNH